MRKTTTLCLLLLTACSTAFGMDAGTNGIQTQVLLPADSQLSYHTETDQPGYIYFQGQVPATGLLVAYWEAQYVETEPASLKESKPIKEMYLRFYPNAPSQIRLPSFLASAGVTLQPERIFLYRDTGSDGRSDVLDSVYTGSDIEDIRSLVEHFAQVPENFLKHREGVIAQPVNIIMDDLVSFIEADHRFLYGKIHTLEPVATTEYLISQIPDSNADAFLGTPWVEMLYSPHSLAIHEAPDQDALILIELPSGSAVIKKLKTVDEDWVLIESTSDAAGSIKGYAKRSALFPMN